MTDESMESILEAARSEVAAQSAGEAPEVKEEPVIEKKADEADPKQAEDPAAGDSAEDEDDADDADGEEVAAAPAEKKSKYIPRGRFNEVNTKLADAKAEIARLSKERDEAYNLVKKDLQPKPKVEEVEELDPLDPVAHKALESKNKALETKIEGLDAKIEAQSFTAALNAEEATFKAKFSNFEELSNEVIATDAFNIMVRERALGNAITEQQALEQAATDNLKTWQKVHKAGKSVGQYMVDRAQALGHKPVAVGGEAAKPKPAASKVNIKELERTRAEAGAPTNKSAGGELEHGLSMEAIMSAARKEVKAQTASAF